MPHEGVDVTLIIDAGNPNCALSSMSVVVYIPLVGLFRVARFDLMGKCEGLTPWNERQELAPRSFLIWNGKMKKTTALGVMRN
ncbi:MAG: hypothetical protein MJZ24_02885 [Paludibacteraceae bacterium]|nr:hypothetical protein [Paludibacteraceae bacterium]